MGYWLSPGVGLWGRCLAVLMLGCGAFSAVQAQTRAKSKVGQAWAAEVTYVVDGDSLWVRSEEGGKRRKLRLYGIDAPEICQVQGPESRKAMEALVRKQPIRVSVRAYDRYGRAIVTVRRMSDDLDIASAMVSKGWAWNNAYQGRKGLYWREETKARKQGKGLFGQTGSESPADFRRRHGPCKTKP